MRVSVALATPDLQTCSVVIENYTADTVSLRYCGLSGNQPKSYANFLAIWESAVIPWTVEPLARQEILQNRETGSQVLTGMKITSSNYIVGYGVGDKITDICATAQISAGGLKSPPSCVHISIAYVGSNSLSVNYSTLPGYLPKTYRNWIGLWEGYASPYNAPEPVGRSFIESDSTQGTAALNNVELGIDSTYTLIYFMGDDPTEGWPRTLKSAAAILNFQTTKGEDDTHNRVLSFSTNQPSQVNKTKKGD